MKLKCCNIKFHTVVNPFGSAYDPSTNPIPLHSSVSTIGLGPCLNQSMNTYPWMAPIFTKNDRSHSKKDKCTTHNTASTACSSLSLHQDLDDSTPLDSPTGPCQTKKPDLTFCSFGRFKKYAKTSPFGVINIKPTLSTSVLAATQPPYLPTDLPILPETDPPKPSDFTKYVPSKYSDFEDIFSVPSSSSTLPPHQPGINLRINIEPGKSPPWGPMYSMSSTEHAMVINHIEDKLAKGHIRLSKSSAGAPILFVIRKTGELCFCVNYQGLNTITKWNLYPLPLCNDLLDITAGCKFFTVIDLRNTFNLVWIAEGNEWKTMFCTHLGLYKMLVMLFRLTNAPANFQSFIKSILTDLINITCVIYLDDILIYSKSQKSHDLSVCQVLEHLRGA